MFDRKLKATQLFPPYSKQGAYNLKATGKGIYYILKNGIIVYIGQSKSNIQGTLYRHFQKWTDKRSDYNRKISMIERVTYYGQNLDSFKIKIIFVNDNNLIDKLEQALIIKHKPRDNAQKLNLFSEVEYSQAISKIKDVEYVRPSDDKDYSDTF